MNRTEIDNAVIYQGDCIEVLKKLPEKSVHCCVTSPPYFNLRDYGKDGQIGLEGTIDDYVSKMVEVFRGVYRVLRDDGTLWLNLGDSYFGSGKGFGASKTSNKGNIASQPKQKPVWESGALKPKNLIGIPWRVAFALQADGWVLRSDIIWEKPNAMPESVRDRPTKSHEYVFMFVKSTKYFYDTDAIREPHQDSSLKRIKYGIKHTHSVDVGMKIPPINTDKMGTRFAHIKGRNKRTVWSVSTKSYKGAHFATYPEKLIIPCILAGTSQKGACDKCGSPWRRVIHIPKSGLRKKRSDKFISAHNMDRSLEAINFRSNHPIQHLGWEPTCECDSNIVPCVVLDPFSGAGTTGVVSLSNRRKYIGIELNDEYIKLSLDRIRKIRRGKLKFIKTHNE